MSRVIGGMRWTAIQVLHLCDDTARNACVCTQSMYSPFVDVQSINVANVVCCAIDRW